MKELCISILFVLLLGSCSSAPAGAPDEEPVADEFVLADKDMGGLPDADGALVDDDGEQGEHDTGDEKDALVGEDEILSDDLPEATDLSDAIIPDDDGLLCQEVPDEYLSFSDHLLGSGQGKIEVVFNNGFNDHYLYGDSNYIKVAIREEWGASMVFFGLADNAGSNVIDANDTGREVQVAFYDPARSMQGCAYNSSCQTSPELACPNSIRYLGWNPVQGGNRCNIGSSVESIYEEVGFMQATVRPLFWNPDWDQVGCGGDGCTDNILKYRQSDVRYHQRVRFAHSNIVEMQMTVENLTATAVQATLQEFPTLYAAYGAHGLANLHNILDSNGTQIAVDIPANDGFFYKNFETPGAWATLQNDERTYGVGIYYENRLTAYQAWQKEGVFNNIRSRFSFGIPANGSVTARAYLLLGSFETIQGLAAWLDSKLPPFGHLDAPALDSAHSGSFMVNGWVLDNKGVASIAARIGSGGGASVTALSLDTDRPDVCAAYPGYSLCDGKVGFSGTVSLDDRYPCSYLLEIVATDTDGNERVIARSRIRVQ
ncbi:MAG TPA: hypothetical protein P5077_02075 [bacterium]|nr:hypothetical protein [bacterium]